MFKIIQFGKKKAIEFAESCDVHTEAVVISIASSPLEYVEFPRYLPTFYFTLPDNEEKLTRNTLERMVRAYEIALESDIPLIIHCEMGVSRSVAVARALADYGEHEYNSPFPGNNSIYRQLYNFLMK